MLHARIASINRADRLAILPFIACRGKTALTAARRRRSGALATAQGGSANPHSFAAAIRACKPLPPCRVGNCTIVEEIASPSRPVWIRFPRRIVRSPPHGDAVAAQPAVVPNPTVDSAESEYLSWGTCLKVTCVQCENGKSISPIDSAQPTMAHDADTD
jgi:hypothetical protein